jgi:hypothetical protein
VGVALVIEQNEVVYAHGKTRRGAKGESEKQDRD